MSGKVTVVMYHYVRDVQQTAYPGIHALSTRHFREQIANLLKNYNLVTMEAVLDSVANRTTLPPKAALLTFDDGYREHYDFVFPELVKNAIQGCFYPPAEAVLHHKLLDVNKIHFILACSPDVGKLVQSVFTLLGRFRKEYSLQSDDYYYRKLAFANRFDSADVIFVKRLLQHELPEPVREQITSELFSQIVEVSEVDFSRELYLQKSQLIEMQNNGMHIGSHGYRHMWLGKLSPAEQESEVLKGRDFIAEIGGDASRWTMSYPYGSYNASLVQLLQHNGCQLAFTTDVAVADLTQHNQMLLPRLDTNDLHPDSPGLMHWWEQG